jgi:hypothetical protein
MKKMLLFFTTLFFAIVSQPLLAQSWLLSGKSDATATSVLGTTNAIPLRLHTNNIERIRIETNGRVGVGTTAPVNLLTVQSSGSVPISKWVIGGNPFYVGFGETTSGNSDMILSMASNSVGSRPDIITRRSRGTLAVPAAVSVNDQLGSFLASGYDGNNFQNPAAIDFYADGAPTAGEVPERVSLVTGSSAATRKERLKVGSTGNFTFNTNQMFLKQSTGALGVGTITPNASPILEINSTTKGVLLPRMTTAHETQLLRRQPAF